MKKIFCLLLFILLFLSLISCRKYLCISKPDKNNEAIAVGFKSIYLGWVTIHYPVAWIMNVKTRTVEDIDVIFQDREDNNQ